MGASPHAFAVVRGRGYRPEQVDRMVAGLIEESRQDWEHVAELTDRAEELRLEAARLWDAVASRPPQEYEALGERAGQLLSLAEAESTRLREAGQADARRTLLEAESLSVARREAAQREAQRVRTDAAAAAARTVEAAKSEGVTLFAEARAAAEEARTSAEENLREVSRRCAEAMAGQERAQAEAQEEAERRLAAREGDVEAYVEGLSARGEQLLREARAERAEAEEAARLRQGEAVARGEELLAAARVREEAVEQETAEVLREHAERAEQLRQHMARVRSTLASLTGREPEAETELEDGADGPDGPDVPSAPGGRSVVVPGQGEQPGGRAR
ncbi:cellulose-binding protein [Streptomyces ovatisporus]|uniref:Cellulose-binding protein n=1 Tax=Streptomyces ovatisporus TaxID=1128682 RepID=A0ABV9A568_9ACTN